jgi:hypothetical protein
MHFRASLIASLFFFGVGCFAVCDGCYVLVVPSGFWKINRLLLAG